MDLYQENIPILISSTDSYTSKKQRLFDYLNATRKRLTDSTNNLVDVLATDQAYNICHSLVSVQEILDRYDTCITKMNAIIYDINKEYLSPSYPYSSWGFNIGLKFALSSGK